MKPVTVVIKKYGNRRLYDTAGSRYVNLDDIARFVREGKELQVVDAKTGQDLTLRNSSRQLSELSSGASVPRIISQHGPR